MSYSAFRSARGYKVVIVGDGASGKTCLFTTYCTNVFPTGYVPTIFQSTDVTITHRGQDLPLTLADTAGQEDYARLRPIAYTDVSVILIAFSIASPESLENVYDTWWPEVSHYCRAGTPIILVGLKSDLRNDAVAITELARNNQTPVTTFQGQNMATRIGAAKYVECSALKRYNLDAVFESVGDVLLGSTKRKKKSGCVIL